MIKKIIALFEFVFVFFLSAFTPGLRLWDGSFIFDPDAHVCSSGLSAFLYNPAGLRVNKNPLFHISHYHLFEEMLYEEAAFSLPFRSFTIGITAGYHKMGDFTIQSSGVETSTLHLYHFLSSGNISFSLFPGFYTGFNINYMYSHYGDDYKASSFSADTGILYRFTFLRFYPVLENNASIGLSVSRIGPQFFYEPELSIPVSVKAGIQYKPAEFVNTFLQVEESSKFTFTAGCDVSLIPYFLIFGSLKYAYHYFRYRAGFSFKIPVTFWQMEITGGIEQLDIDNVFFMGLRFADKNRPQEIKKTVKEKIVFPDIPEEQSPPAVQIHIQPSNNVKFNSVLETAEKDCDYFIQDENAEYLLTFQLSQSNSLYVLHSSLLRLSSADVLKEYIVKFKSEKAWQNIIRKIFEKSFEAVVRRTDSAPFCSINTFSDKYIILVDHKDVYTKQCLIGGESESFYQIYKNTAEGAPVFQSWIAVTNQSREINLPFSYSDNFQNRNFAFWCADTDNNFISRPLFGEKFKAELQIKTQHNKDFIFGITDEKEHGVFFEKKGKRLFAETSGRKEQYSVFWNNKQMYSLMLICRDSVCYFYVNHILFASFPEEKETFHRIVILNKQSFSLSRFFYSTEINP